MKKRCQNDGAGDLGVLECFRGYVVFSEDQLPDGVFKPVPMAATGGQMGSGHAGWLSVCA